jgi:uncharacterized protein involved in type VI secretion and phage assembly
MSKGPPYFGKYRGLVADNKDPLMTGRIKATVPDVLGSQKTGWALPCAPFGGSQVGFFAIPTVGAGVWIEFEHGNLEYPVWSGCWWGSPADMPPLILAPPYQKTMIVTSGGQSITLDDTPGIGGITLTTSGGQKLVLSPTGVVIDDGMGGRIELRGPKVNINGPALQVT